jgi:hypothetical protein
MPSVNYMKDATVKEYYERWALLPKLLGQEKEYFYQFVKACLKMDRKLDIDYLKGALYDSFHEQYDEKYYDEFVYEVVVLFEHLRNFSNTTLP